ncbi:hypothetical protein DAKH74_047140 [Maudiozyma humilis]|uniref:Zn(2)-C6 fungal-type domain-containing protein n=1 Tax=Maudiozyma humilis TaxID=51915 RepID=A0AAV5S2Z8_MAUHU|nr:hypothetical protein DAKH74_047140 [Kazachstania humilis]
MSQSAEVEKKTVKRRRRTLNTCLFCKKRKLKCDHSRPKCQQCSIRKLPECVYTNGFNFDVALEELLGGEMKYPSVTVETTAVSGQSSSVSTTAVSSVAGESPECSADGNLLKYQYFDSQDGAFHQYGPTSWKSIVNYKKGAFEREYIDLWNAQKKRYPEWQETRKRLENRPPSCWLYYNDVDDIIKAICNVLPTYEKARDTIDKFFNSTLHDVYMIVDRKKTIDTFNSCFRVAPVEPSFEGLMTDVFTDIVVPPNGNLYIIGIILLIISHTMPNFNPDKSLSSFLEQLAFSPKFSDNFVERPQFLLLMYILREYQSNLPVWETDQNNKLIMSICQSCTSLGLSNIDKWAAKTSYSSDEVYSLKRTFYWTIFFDVKVAFEEGRPLCLSDDVVDYPGLYNLERNDLEQDRELRRSSIMTRFLALARPIVNSLNSAAFNDRSLLEKYTRQLVEFYESDYMPVKYYTRPDKLMPTDTFDLPFVALGVSILLTLYHIRKKYFREKSMEVNNGIIKYSVIIVSFCCKTVVWADQMDSFTDPLYHINKEAITHHLRLAVLMSAPTLKRVIFQLYDYLFQNISQEKLGFADQVRECRERQGDYTSLYVPIDTFDIDPTTYYQLIPAMHQIEDIEKSVLGPDQLALHKRLQNSNTFVTLSALQMISHLLATHSLKCLKCPDDGQMITQTGSELWNEYRKNASGIWRLNIFELVERKLSPKRPEDHLICQSAVILSGKD